MFQGFTDKTIEFMWNIRFNNEKSWFEAHREEYKEVLERPMHELAQEVYGEFSEKHGDLDLHLHVSRIYRDARRLFGRGPYKDHLWFSMRQSENWEDRPSFWFEITPENWSYGLGYCSVKPATMMKLRARIDTRPEPLQKLDSALSEQSEFVLAGENYARPRREPGSPLSNWYNKKDFFLIHEEGITGAVLSPELAGRLKQGFEFLLPYCRYFLAMAGDPDPRR